MPSYNEQERIAKKHLKQGKCTWDDIEILSASCKPDDLTIDYEDIKKAAERHKYTSDNPADKTAGPCEPWAWILVIAFTIRTQERQEVHVPEMAEGVRPRRDGLQG